MGRRTKLTPELADILVEAVGLGLSFGEAARIGQITERSIHAWRERGGSETDTIYSRFTDRLDAAQASRAQEYLDAVKRSILEDSTITKTHKRETVLPAVTDSDGRIISPAVVKESIEETMIETRPPDIKGALWWLERRLPALFGRRTEIGGQLGIAGLSITYVLPDGKKVGDYDEGEVLAGQVQGTDRIADNRADENSLVRDIGND